MIAIQEKNIPADKISIAPMLDWTDRHFRYFLRFICHRPVFYTEMIASPALILGRRDELLKYDFSEQPLVLQVGGSDPTQMSDCAKFAEDYGFYAVNINAGCPSSRVQSGQFGAVLMKTPERVADCVASMCSKVKIPVTVKTRISLVQSGGDGFDQLFRFASLVFEAGCRHLIIHARQAKLNISPKENRSDRLPLNYDVVYRLKKSFPDLFITINGNILSMDSIYTHLEHTNGVMIGRWAYGNPYALKDIDRLFYHDDHPVLSRFEIMEQMIPYLFSNQKHLSIILPHLMGLFHGQPNAKTFKQTLMTRDLKAIQQMTLLGLSHLGEEY